MYYSEKIDGKHFQTWSQIEKRAIMIRLKRFDYSRRKTAQSFNKSVRWLKIRIEQYRTEGHVIPDDPNWRPVIDYTATLH